VKAAAFFDLDGTVVDGNILRSSLYLARRAAGLGGRIAWLSQMAGTLPLLAAAELAGWRSSVNELHYAGFRGTSEDRLRLLARDLFDEVLRPRIFPAIRELIAEHAAAGVRPVLLTGALDVVAAPIARHLGVDTWAANRLVYERGVATGRLQHPVLAGAAKASWVRRFAEREGVDLGRCHAYADDLADLPLLAVVGHPSAVNPSAGLARVARENRWPVLRLERRRSHSAGSSGFRQERHVR
jgi:HAD superfamily hydrolase (TIGR01490 family)